MTAGYNIYGFDFSINLVIVASFIFGISIFIFVTKIQSLKMIKDIIVDDVRGITLLTYMSSPTKDESNRNVMGRNLDGIQSFIFDIMSDVHSLLFTADVAIKVLFLRRATLLLIVSYGVAALTLWSAAGICKTNDCEEFVTQINYSLLQSITFGSFYLIHLSCENKRIISIGISVLLFYAIGMLVSMKIFEHPYVHNPHLLYVLYFVIIVYIVINGAKRLALGRLK